MQSRIFFVFILVFSIVRNVFSQELTEEEKAKYIGYLDSIDNNESIVLEALWVMTYSNTEEFRNTEAIPALERNIWRVKDPYDKYLFLKAMWKLRSPNTLAYARAFIDSTDSFKGGGFIDSLLGKVYATEILFDLGDYSTASYVFDYLKRDSISFHSMVILLLDTIALRVPEYSERAKTELIRIALNHPDNKTRWLATVDLSNLYGLQIIDVLLHVAVNDSSVENRMSTLVKLMKLNYPGITNLLYDRLYKEVALFRCLIADSLLRRYGTPKNYQVVKEYFVWESDIRNKTIIGFIMENIFKPPRPDSTVSIESMLDSLISYKHQCYKYKWLTGEEFVTELDNYLIEGWYLLSGGDSIGCACNVKRFQQAVEAEYRDTVDRTPAKVTVEGWKFLYYNAQYILDRLPSIPAEPLIR